MPQWNGYDTIMGDNYYVHIETSNKSFRDMHYFLKQIGIKNNTFMLKLYDTNLIGIDPHDPNLTTYQKAAVLREIMLNYWYFIREVVRIPVQGTGDKGAPYKIHIGNLSMGVLFLCDISMYVEFSRQHYKTKSALCWYLWLYNFASSNSEIIFAGKDHNGSKQNLRDLKEIRDLLPEYLQLTGNIGLKGQKIKVPNTVQTIQHPINHNKIVTYASARSKEAADKMGRGSTTPCQYIDEISFVPYIGYFYTAAAPAFSRASRNAEANGVHYGILATTTPGDLATEEGQFVFALRNNATPWNLRYLDMTKKQLKAMRDANTNSFFFSIIYDYKQLGSGPDYFKEMVILLNRNWAAIRREIMLCWSRQASNCAFSSEHLETIATMCHEPIRTIFFGQYNQYQMQIFEEIDLRNPPIIGVDVSGALYNDSSAITVIDSKTTKVCAIMNCNYIPSDDLADVVYVLVNKYLPNAIVNIERNGEISYINKRYYDNELLVA